MITHVDLTLLPADLRTKVLDEYRVALMAPERRLSYREAAWLYGYTYMTMRVLVSRGRIKTVGRAPNRRITHATMRNYITSKRIAGRPRKSLKQRQTALA
jgi:hypothetical protein